MSKIPEEVLNYFRQVDQGWKADGTVDKSRIDGKLDQQEVDYVKKHISVFTGEQGIKVTAGMTIFDMIKANNYMRSRSVLGDKDYNSGRRVTVFGYLIRTIFGRNKSTDNNKSIEVDQGQYAVKKYSQEFPAMQTWNVQNCVAVTIYDKVNKRGFMAHIDCTSKAYDLKNVLKKLGFKPENCEARIIGGRDEMSEGNVEIIDNILRCFKFDIVEQDVLGKKIRAIQMDLNTGEVTDYEETVESKQGRDSDNYCYVQKLGKNIDSD